MDRIGFIGLGSQGGPMARCIVDSGFPLVLWARRPDALAPFADTAAEIATSVADLGARVDHVGICVVDDAGVRQVADQLLPAMRAGSRIAIHSTVNPQTVIDIARAASGRGVAVIDAPVSGGGLGAAARTLTVMLGGDEVAIQAARPVFETFGAVIVRLGEVGAGQMAKLINNALMAAHMAIAHHALTAGETLGLDGKALRELVKVSSGRSFGFETYARLPTPSAFAHGAKLLTKDVRLLGEVLGNDPSFAPFRDLAAPFLESLQRPDTDAGRSS